MILIINILLSIFVYFEKVTNLLNLAVKWGNRCNFLIYRKNCAWQEGQNVSEVTKKNTTGGGSQNQIFALFVH